MNLHTNLGLTLFRWVRGADLGISAVSATFLWIFPAVSLWLGSCFGDFRSFSYFFEDFSGSFAVIRELFWEFQRFQLLFSRIFLAFGLDLGSCFRDFRSFSYFFEDFSSCFAVIRGTDLWISADSATFLWIFPAVSLWLGSCFGAFSGFSYFFGDFSGSFAVIRGAVLEILVITAAQGLSAINIWLLYIMLI